MKFLVCNEGSQAASHAAALGAELAGRAGAQAVTLRVVATQAEAERQRAADTLIRVGDPVTEILAEAARDSYQLVVIGAHARPSLAHLFTGSTASRLAKRSRLPLLIVKSPTASLQRILACTGGEAPGEFSSQWGGRVAAWAGASLTILHIMSQVALTHRAKFDDLDDNAEEAIRESTREGLHLEKAIGLARAAGVTGEVKPKIRHGPVLDEILAEAGTGNYDLVVVGAHYIASDDPLRLLVLEDLTDQIVRRCPRNVLVARQT